jgi:hypothetical protein
MNLLFGYKPRFPLWTSMLVAVLFALAAAGCAPASTATQPTGPTDNCGPIEPTDADIQKMLSFGKESFTSNDWQKSYTVEPYKISLTRRNDAIQAIAQSDYFIFTCGYGQTEMGNTFNDANFNLIFSNYESHALSKFCEIKNLALYEYDLTLNGQPFKARYWVKQDTDTRILAYELVFPQTGAATLNEYSQKIFPDLSACK